MRTLLTALALLLGLAVVLGVPQWAAAQEEAAGEEEAIPEAKVPLRIPEKEKVRKNPIPPSEPSIQHGAELFVTQCTMCHGVTGDGKGDLVARLGLDVPDFTDPEVQGKRTDGELFYILTAGHGDMPGEGERIPEEWKWDLVNYIRTLRE